MPAQLIALYDGPNILLDKPVLLIGRDPECDLQLDSRKVSRRHCCIAQVNDYLVVRDLDSTNGIRINGVRVLEGKLKDADELMIGGCKFQVRWDSHAPRPAAPLRRAPALKPIRADDDSLLEKYDVPVPLVEAIDSLPLETPEEPKPGRRQPLPANPGKPVLPDHIDLAPPSEVRPPAPRSE